MTVPTHARHRFREAAAPRGLLDVAYDLADSPIGPLLVGRDRAGPLPDLVLDPSPRRSSTRSLAPSATRVLRAGSRSTRSGVSWTSTSTSAGARSTSRST